MTLNLAKTRRVEALSTRKADRILVKPAAQLSRLRMPDTGTVADYLIDALRNGVSADDLANETGWSKSTVMVNLYKVAKKTGVGIRRREDVLRLILPKGYEAHHSNAKVVNMHCNIDAKAAEIVIHAVAEEV